MTMLSHADQWEREIIRALEADEVRARNDAMRHMVADLPDPAKYARYLPAAIVQMLLGATRSANGYKVYGSIAKELRPYGLCDYCSNELTNFGCAVRRALKAEDA